MPKVVIAGASGVIGSAAVERFADDGWEVIAVSRGKPDLSETTEFQHLALDLFDRDSCVSSLSALSGVTHLVYCAVYERPGLIDGWRDSAHADKNLAMLQNCLEPLEMLGSLRHVSILQGTKAYGAHLHPIPIPARERQVRDDHDNFYWLQEDYIRQRANGWKFTILRPQAAFGGSVGVAMNPIPVIGVYAAICKALDLPFSFPGGQSYIWQAADVRIVAGALRWAAENSGAAGETFNVTNGEVAEWRNLWPAIADALRMEAGPDRPRRLASFLPENADVWDEIVSKSGLRRMPLDHVLGQSHHATDFIFGSMARRPPPPALVSTVKIRAAGFGECMDTEEMFRYWFENLENRRILPK